MQTNLFTVVAKAVGLSALLASRVDANNEFSAGRAQASIDHGALSYILQAYSNANMRERIRTAVSKMKNKKLEEPIQLIIRMYIVYYIRGPGRM